MEPQTYPGVSLTTLPFVTSILAPQLKQRNLPLSFATPQAVATEPHFTYILTDESLPREVLSSLSSIFANKAIGIALFSTKDFKKKLMFLELGFHHCIELPTATEIIVRTIANSVKKPGSSMLSEPHEQYGTERTPFSFLQDYRGNYFLSHGGRAYSISRQEYNVLEYLSRRQGVASRNELAYAGWKTFAIKQNTVTVTVKKLRQKFTELQIPCKIRNLYGFGYTLESFLS